MQLRSSPTSPFVRKVKIAAALTGLSASITLVDSDTRRGDESLNQQNPLGKVPCLILDNGEMIYDSAVIVEYLDAEAGGNRLIPAKGPERFRVLTLQTLADGMMDASILIFYEKHLRAAESYDSQWVARQQGKVERSLFWLETHLPNHPQAASINVGQIALACSLGYLDLRFAGQWRKEFVKLVAWLEAFDKAVPSFAATRAPA